MSNWQWTTPSEMLFTGVIYLRETGDVKHFYTGLNKTICGLVVKEFLPSEDAIVTCENCRNTSGFFETESGSIFEIVTRFENGELRVEKIEFL